MTSSPRDRRMLRGLERILSKSGIASRTQAAEWIRAGRVRVNGAVILDPEAWFDPERDAVTLDGRRVAQQKKLYVVLHKPRGYLTTHRDPSGRPTVYDLIADVDAWVIPVGRLDADTSGMLLLTNDTQFAERITNPASHVEKTYRVETRPALTDDALDALRGGVVLHDGPTRPARVERVDRGATLDITITEGRNRQVRRMVKAAGGRVVSLARIAIGPVAIGRLEPGAWRRLTSAELRSLGEQGSRRK
jgi:pseudouridine synthase